MLFLPYAMETLEAKLIRANAVFAGHHPADPPVGAVGLSQRSGYRRGLDFDPTRPRFAGINLSSDQILDWPAILTLRYLQGKHELELQIF